MKLSVLKSVVFGAVFLISLIVFTFLTNRGNMDMTAKMEDATLPLIYLDVNGREVNCLAGYQEKMQVAYVQECTNPRKKQCCGYIKSCQNRYKNCRTKHRKHVLKSQNSYFPGTKFFCIINSFLIFVHFLLSLYFFE